MAGSESADCMSDLLGVDHRELDAVLADVKRLLAAGDMAEAHAPFGAFRAGLERHIEAEEQVLSPSSRS